MIDEYRGKNIEFVSVSVDENCNYELWKKTIKDNNMQGVQLFSSGNKVFKIEFRLKSFPRFMIIDPNGNFIEANAPKPSNPKLLELLKTLKL